MSPASKIGEINEQARIAAAGRVDSTAVPTRSTKVCRDCARLGAQVCARAKELQKQTKVALARERFLANRFRGSLTSGR